MRECSPPPNLSYVTCHLSRVTCHVSSVTCHVSGVTFFFRQSGEAYWRRVCYQRSLPRLVFTPLHLFSFQKHLSRIVRMSCLVMPTFQANHCWYKMAIKFFSSQSCKVKQTNRFKVMFPAYFVYHVILQFCSSLKKLRDKRQQFV